MNNATLLQNADLYRKVNAETEVMDASPHRVIQMLMEGALSRIAKAKGHMLRNDSKSGEVISLAISIIDGLRSSLDLEVGGDMAQNLDGLYEYMTLRLFEANKHQDPKILDEVTGLIKEIKSGWDNIPESYHQLKRDQINGSTTISK